MVVREIHHLLVKSYKLCFNNDTPLFFPEIISALLIKQNSLPLLSHLFRVRLLHSKRQLTFYIFLFYHNHG